MNSMNCTKTRRDKLIAVEEKGKKFVLSNPQRVEVKQTQIDGCLYLNNKERRCDYLFEYESPSPTMIFLELKGKNIKDAYRQLISTLDTFREKRGKRKVYCFVVASRVPKTIPGVQNLVIELSTKYEVVLRVRNKQAEFSLSAN
ncbi:MAG: hypothetical protein K2X81_26040 [Candidatus Obscuribacterales bacterium]|nr:hypothetical protein [Candidatus Obscuribacterales bacterium]